VALGLPVHRIDGPAKVTGTADYAADVKLPGLLYAVLVSSAVAHGRVRLINSTAAQNVNGVRGVFTHENLPPLVHQPIWDLYRGNGMSFAPMQSDRIHYAGQAVAIVVAETLEQAEHASSLVACEYDVEAPVPSLDEATVFDIEHVIGVLPAHYHRGDAAAALAGAAHTVEQTYAISAHRHHPIELASTTAMWSGDRLTVWETTQGVSMTQWNAAEALGLSIGNVRVISHYVGGAFGCKGHAWFHTWLAAQVAQLIGQPVRLVISRNQMATTVGRREEQVHAMTLAVADSGVLTGIRHVKTSETSRFDDFAEPSCNTTQMLYACPNVETVYRLGRVDSMTPAFMRGTGGFSGCYALECALDELAYELSMDPVELRLRNHADVDPRTGARWSSKALQQCYQLAGNEIGWDQRDPRPRSMTSNGLLVGYGMASATYPVNQRELTEVQIRVFSDHSAVVRCGAQDLGTGTYTIAAQIAADGLGLEVRRISVQMGDTDYPRAGNSSGATTATAVATAVRLAAQGLRQRIVELAVSDPRSPLHGMAPDDVLVEDGRMTAGQSGITDSYAETLHRRLMTSIEGFGQWDPASGLGDVLGRRVQMVRGKTSSWSFGAWFVVVTVDPDLGLVRVVRMSGAWGAGRILNRKTAESQMRGGGVMGIGQALLETSAVDRRTARLVNPGLNEYLIPSHADVPQIDVAFVDEQDSEINPLGAKGIGELGVVGAAPAIANAVFHATARRIRHLPIVPEDLL
jgi:xanthine dehydrogenase YagR molybdenum-binding subunit